MYFGCSLLGPETIFGWILTGPVPAPRPNQIFAFSARISNTFDTSLDTLLTKFWEVEELPVSDKIIRCDLWGKVSPDYHERPQRHVYSMPSISWSWKLKISPRSLQILRVVAVPKNRATSKKGQSSENQIWLRDSRVSRSQPHERGPFYPWFAHYYLPHHAVLEPESTTIKLRYSMPLALQRMGSV